MTFLFYHDLDIQSQFSDSDTIPPQAILDLEPLDFNQSIPVHEKTSLENGHHHHCEHGQETLFLEHDSTSCPSHNSSFRLRRFKFLLPTIFFLVVALVGLLAWSCVNGMPVLGVNLMRRDTSNTNTSTTSIVAAVGAGIAVLLLVLVSWALFKYKGRDRQINGRQQPIKNPEVPLQPQWDPSGNLDPEDVLRFVSKLSGA